VLNQNLEVLNSYSETYKHISNITDKVLTIEISRSIIGPGRRVPYKRFAYEGDSL